MIERVSALIVSSEVAEDRYAVLPYLPEELNTLQIAPFVFPLVIDDRAEVRYL